MADIKKIKLPSGSEYNLKDYRIPGVDTTPTSGSDNIVTSGGIYTALNNAIGSVYRVKGTKATYANLPSSGNVAGDVWNVTAAYGNYPAGTNWVWTGSEWDALGGEIDLSSKQDVLTFDSTPTANSTNPVTSGGVYQSVIDASLVTSAALNDLNTRVETVESRGNGKLFFGTCDTAGATADKVVTCPEFTESDLTVGTAIMVSFDNVNSGAVASLTLNVNNTGAYSIKKLYNTGIANLTSAGEIRASNYLFSYTSSESWIMMNTDYNSIYTLDRLTHTNGRFTAYNTGYRYQLFVHTDPDHIAAFNQNSNATGTTKTILTDLEFDPFDEIYYYITTSTVAANANFAQTYLYYVYPTVDLRYTFNISASYQPLAYPKNVYLKITMLSNGKAKLASADPLTTDLPSTNDGIYYLFLGRSHSEYQIALYCEHPIYYHDGTKVCEFKKDQVQFDTIPTENSTNAVTSGGIYNAIDEIEEVTATALNNLNDRINSVESDLNDIDTPGTLNTTATTAQTTSSSESLSGTINLHKVAKTGTYSDLIGTPTIPAELWKPGTGTNSAVLNTAENEGGSASGSNAVSAGRRGHASGNSSFAEGYAYACGFASHAEGDGYDSATILTYTRTGTKTYTYTNHGLSVGDYLFCENTFKVAKVTSVTNANTFVTNVELSTDSSFQAYVLYVGAFGDYSHTEGVGTKTLNEGEHAEGRYNLSNTGSTDEQKTIHSIGIGTNQSDSNRKNAVEVMKNGDVYIKGIGSYDGTNYSSASTLQSVIGNIPAAVTESTVSGWGFTKNTGTLTGVSFNGTTATVTNGVASITSIPVIVLTWNANDTLTFPSNVNPSSIPNNVPIIVTGDGFVNALQTVDSAASDANYGLITLTKYKPENTEEEYGQFFEICGMVNYDGESLPFYADFETSFGGSTFSKTYFFGQELFSNGNIATSFYGGIGITDSMVPSAVLVWNTFQALPQILSGTSDPSSSLGNNGDIYIKLSS